jgi:hypothetical protein
VDQDAEATQTQHARWLIGLLTESWCSTATNAPERAKGNGGDDATTNRERNEKLRANTDAAIVFGGGGPLGDVLV